MSNNDENLDDKQLSSIYAQTDQSLPAKHIDDAILSAAKRETLRGSTNPFSFSWRVPASLAAVIVVSVGLVTLIENDLSSIDGVIPETEFSIASDESADVVVLEKKLKQALTLSKPTKKISSKPARTINPAMSAAETVEQEIRKRTIAKQRTKQLAPESGISSFSLSGITDPIVHESIASPIASLAMIRKLRLAGDRNAANEAVDSFIRQYFDDDIDKVDLTQIELSQLEWEELIKELRKLAREDIANKLEARLVQRGFD